MDRLRDFLKNVNPTNFTFLVLTHIMGVWGIVEMSRNPNWRISVAGFAMFALCGLAITAGYHRHYAHRSHQASWPVQLLYLVLGAFGVQNKAKIWAADHINHHDDPDGKWDNYSIIKGFWWAHIVWVVTKHEPPDLTDPRFEHLVKNKLVQLQAKYYVHLVVIRFAIAYGLGHLWGNAWGGFLFIGFTALLLQYHATFCVNSVAHWLGTRPYDTTISARDHWLTALITFGEGYHNFHHTFPSDYRNAIGKFQWDPTKWLIKVLEKVGLVWDLYRTPDDQIEDARRRAAQLAYA